MKRILSIWLFALALSAGAAVTAVRPFEDYQTILDRKPFGAPPDASLVPERVVPVSESFAAQMQLSGIYELDDGNLRVAVTDKKDNSYFALMVGEKNDQGIELIDADYEKEEATLQKGDEVVVLSMSNTAGGQVLSTVEREDRVKQAEEHRMSYAERRRQRMLERQKPVEIPKPMYTGEELEKHLQDYQMQVIREGLPPLPVQLTPDRDAQLVAEGLLPPIDEEGYEIDTNAPAGDEYYPDEAQ
jgi:hypothetical protein